MAFYTVHFDDSGTHPESNFAVAACFVSTVEQWKEFQRNWDGVNEREPFGVFHMADFAACEEQFVGWTEEKKRRILTALCGTIHLRANQGFAIVINKSDFDAVVPPNSEWRVHFGRFHYTFAVRQCATHIRTWHRQFGKSRYLRYIFDRMTKGTGKGEIISVMDRAVEQSELDRGTTNNPVLEGYGFEDKSIIKPLQAADILAWSALQGMLAEMKIRRPLKCEAQLVFDILRLKICVSYFTRERLAQWVEEEKAAVTRIKTAYSG